MELGNMDQRGMDAERPERLHLGRSEEQRIAWRRHRLVDAGIRIAGTRGYAQLGVRQVCAEADLSHRYFYESFGCTDELLLAAYEQLQANLIATAMLAMGSLTEHCSTRLNRSVGAFLNFFEHNTHARWIPFFDSALLRALSKDPNWRLLSAYEAMLADELRRGGVGSDQAAQATASGLLGATIQLTVRWLATRPCEPIDETLAALQFIHGAAIQSLQDSNGAVWPKS